MQAWFRKRNYRISIHALVKRATFPVAKIGKDFGNFNPRPREEGDFIVINGSWRYPSNFNPRPREEGDRHSIEGFHFGLYFNPRPREEGDKSGTKKLSWS